ncbi:hypothetical protein PhCBS80983_g03150 [Powellomyces hirtus]|uniref:RGS domain-containing protein n=1 Tax=Powellomyces hirtus TaxID=109895 RepID=A0A507E4X3_9FUNG|nr:hypothetical protein PhCBS80983_g03150 [Powellomyces hirtus]
MASNSNKTSDSPGPRLRSSSFGQKILPSGWRNRDDSNNNNSGPQSSNPGSRRTSIVGGGGANSPKLSDSKRGSISAESQRRTPSTTSRWEGGSNNNNNNSTSSEGEGALERRARIARVMSKQQQRISSHIQLFSKITVTVSGTDVTMTVTVSRSDTIEVLSKLIEAEYAYMFFLNEDEERRPNVADKQKEKRDPLVIGQVYDAGQLALKFDDRIGDVLGFTDRVSVINAFEGESVNRTMAVDELNENQVYTSDEISGSDLWNRAASGDLLLGSSDLLGTDSSDKPTESISSIVTAPKKKTGRTGSHSTLDDRLQLCLRNKLALRYFSESCAEEYTIENLLFWLDVEVFQSLPLQHREMYARYIYLTYVSCVAPLQVNIPAEIRNDIPWPFPDTMLDETIFDEAQEQVYAMIKAHSFIRFEKNAKYKLFLEARAADHEEFVQGRMAGPFANHFQANIETARAILPMLEKTAAQDNRSPKSATVKFRESMLSKTVAQYFPLANRIMEGYFNENQRSSWGNKQKRMNKEKKLAKFFGERPSVELIQRQIAQASASYLQQRRDLSRESLTDSPTDQETIKDDDDSEYDPMSQGMRRKKKEKLEEFFGDKLPKQQRKVQQLMVAGETSSELEVSGDNSDEDEPAQTQLETMETTNELDPEDRRILQRRTKKIASMLGESLDEKTISKRVTSAALQERSNEAGEPGSTSRKQSDAYRRPSLLPPRDADADLLAEHQVGTGEELMDSDDDGDSKLAHKRRLDKISSLLGQRIGVSDILDAKANFNPNLQPAVPSRPLTIEEKKLFHKKSSKLERLLGTLPPVEAIMASLPCEQKPELQRVRKSLVGLSFLVKNAKNAVEILDALTEITEEKVDTEAANDSLKSLAGGSSPDLSKESKQRKLNKLRKFFGDKISVEMLLETQILADLERSFNDVTSDEMELDRLRAEVNSIREEVRRRSDEFREDLNSIGASSNEGSTTVDILGHSNYAPTSRGSVSNRPKELVPRSSVTGSQESSSSGTGKPDKRRLSLAGRST